MQAFPYGYIEINTEDVRLFTICPRQFSDKIRFDDTSSQYPNRGTVKACARFLGLKIGGEKMSGRYYYKGREKKRTRTTRYFRLHEVAAER